SDPPGAEVKLSDRSLGLTPIADRDWIAGTYRLSISRQGYDPQEEEVRIDAGGRLPRKYKLVPNARSVQIFTSPREVKVVVGGVEGGATFGTAGPAYEEVAKAGGVAASEISEPLLIEYLKPGRHAIVLRKECYEDFPVELTVEIDPANNAPSVYKPFVL